MNKRTSKTNEKLERETILLMKCDALKSSLRLYGVPINGTRKAQLQDSLLKHFGYAKGKSLFTI